MSMTLSWSVEACGGVFTNGTGELRSPYFPNPYPNDRECIYVIRQAEGTTITLSFVSFDVEASFGANCTFDFVEVQLIRMTLVFFHLFFYSW